MTKLESVSYCVLAAVLAFGPGVACAQDAAAAAGVSKTPGPATESSGEIIVTAQKRSESINKVPLSITAVSGDQLKAAGIVSTADLTKVVSGFQVVQSQTGTPVYFLRGVGFNDLSLGSRPAVTIYADEAPLPFSVMSLGSTLDLERVEVLKGPQGLLFGSNSTGGAINFISAKPTNTFQAGADGSFGRFNQYSLSGFVSGPINDQIRVRAAISHDGGDPWQYDVINHNRKIGQRDVTSGRVTVQIDPIERLHVTLTAQHTVDHSDPQQGQYFTYDTHTTFAGTLPLLQAYPPSPHDDRAAGWDNTGPVGQPLQRNNNQTQLIGRIDLELTSKITLTSLTNYVKHHEEYATDADGTDLDITKFGLRGDLKAFTQELRLIGSIGNRLNFILGGNYEHDKSNERADYDVTLASSGNAFTPFNIGPPIDDSPILAQSKFTSKAVFGNVDYNIVDRLTAHAGVRYTSTVTHQAACSIFGPTVGDRTLIIGLGLINVLQPGDCYSLNDINGSFAPGLFVNELPEHNVSWKGGLDYHLTPGTMFYASVSRGYKAGAYSNIASLLQSQLLPVPQERLTAYEAGVKSDIIRNVLHVNAAYFYYDYANKQLTGTVLVFPFGPLQRLVSVPKSWVQGGEFEATLRPFNGVTLGGSVTYVDSKVTSHFNGSTRFGPVVDFFGANFPDTPKWQGTANAEYRFAVNTGLDAYLGGNMTFRSKAYGDFIKNELISEKAYKVFDARIGVESRDHAWLVELFGRNIFNEYYYPATLRPSDTIYRYTGMPATYGVRASLRFK